MDDTRIAEPGVPVTVTRVEADLDWRASAQLLDEYRGWLGRAVGLDLATAQPAAPAEFEDLAGFYRMPDGVLAVGWVGGHPAGLVGVHRLTGAVGELKRMYVSPWARGQGLGRTLLAEAVVAAVDLEFSELRLQTKPDAMAAADRLYREYGFCDVESYADLGLDGVTSLALELRPPGPALDRKIATLRAQASQTAKLEKEEAVGPDRDRAAVAGEFFGLPPGHGAP